MTARHLSIQLSLLTASNDRNTQPPLPSRDLTPPVTPTVDGDGALPSSTSSRPSQPDSSFLSPVEPTTEQAVSLTNQHVWTPLEFPDQIEISKDESGYPVEFGRGVWSVVYMASSPVSSKASSLPTPPSSPVAKARIFAVKTPARRDAHSVLYREALTLTRIRLAPGYERHIVPFHGYISNSYSIVMSAVPLTLSTYIEDKAGIAQKQLSTRTMFEPVQGMAQWQDLAKKLVSALSWLHNGARIVHGDIKPHNFLLRPRQTGINSNPDEFPYDPLFGDFSSAHEIGFSSTTMNETEFSMSALTPPFTAPELLSVQALKSPGVGPTPASDVFSLAVTLLAAVTGDLLIYPGSSSMQRLAMAREGHRVLDFARSGPNCSRVPRNGTVERILEPAIKKEPTQRITPDKWLELIEAFS